MKIFFYQDEISFMVLQQVLVIINSDEKLSKIFFSVPCLEWNGFITFLFEHFNRIENFKSKMMMTQFMAFFYLKGFNEGFEKVKIFLNLKDVDGWQCRSLVTSPFRRGFTTCRCCCCWWWCCGCCWCLWWYWCGCCC